MNKTEKILAQRMVDMAQKELKTINDKIEYNKRQIKKYSEENTAFKRERKPLTSIINEWYLILNKKDK